LDIQIKYEAGEVKSSPDACGGGPGPLRWKGGTFSADTRRCPSGRVDGSLNSTGAWSEILSYELDVAKLAKRPM